MAEKIDRKTAEEFLNSLQSLQKHPAYEYLMAWVDECTRGVFARLVNESDPTKLAKLVGNVSTLKEVRSRIDFEIASTMSYLKGESL